MAQHNIETKGEEIEYLSLQYLDKQISSLLKKKTGLLRKELEKTNELIVQFSKPCVDTSGSENKQCCINSDVALNEKNKKQILHHKERISRNIITKKPRNERNDTKKIPTITTFIILIVFVGFLTSLSFQFSETDQEEPKKIKSKYLIENLKGDTVETWKYWRLIPGDTLNVNIVNGDKIEKNKFNSVISAIMSLEALEIDDSITHKGPKGTSSKYYVGWVGAMKDASKKDTIYSIPTDFNIIESSKGEGDIIIRFSNLRDADGYSGFTKSIVEDNEILKSFITIYDVGSLSDDNLAGIVRHEFGHALGLGHSSAPEDLMYPIIETDFPYISECDVDAIAVLYNGQEENQAVCEK